MNVIKKIFSRYGWRLFITILTLSLATAAFKIPAQFNEWKESIGLAASVITLGAFVINLIEIGSLKSTNEAVKEAVDKNRKSIEAIGEVMDFSQYSQMILEMTTYFQTEKWELAHLRMTDVYLLIKRIELKQRQYGIDKRELEDVKEKAEGVIRSLNQAKCGNLEGVEKREMIFNYFDTSLRPFLSKICNNIKTIHTNTQE